MVRNSAGRKESSFRPALGKGVPCPRAGGAGRAGARRSSLRFGSLLDHHLEGLLAHHAPERLFDTLDRPFAGEQEIGPETGVGEQGERASDGCRPMMVDARTEPAERKLPHVLP